VSLIEAIENNIGRKPEQASADSGYCSDANLAARKHCMAHGAGRRDPFRGTRALRFLGIGYVPAWGA
jgi:hypothetical protein